MWLASEKVRFFANQSRCWMLRSGEQIRLVKVVLYPKFPIFAIF